MLNSSSSVQNGAPVLHSLPAVPSKPGILRQSANAVGALVMGILRLLGNFVYSPVTFCNWAFGKKAVALPAQISQAPAKPSASPSSSAPAPEPAPAQQSADQAEPPAAPSSAPAPEPAPAQQSADQPEPPVAPSAPKVQQPLDLEAKRKDLMTQYFVNRGSL